MSESFEKLSVIELRQKAKEMGVKLGAGINKQGIIEKLMEAAGSQEPEVPETPQEPAVPVQESVSRPIRSAAIITDDEEIDEEDVPLLTPNPALRSPARLNSRPVAAANTAPNAMSSLSTISAKAPAFTMEGSRAWHNPRTYQAQGSNYQRPAGGNSWTRPSQVGSQDQRGYTRPDPRAQQRPQQPMYVNRFGPDQPAQEAEPYRGYVNGPTQQDYSGAPMNSGYNQGGYSYSQPGYAAPHREQGINAGLSEILAAGDCYDGEGVLEVLPDGYGFLRTNHFMPGRQDVYISNAQIRRFSLRTGDYIIGKVRPQRESDRYSAMLYITEINGSIPDDMPERPRFDELTPIYPKKKITLSAKKENDPILRLIDLLCPIGFGQRALLCCAGRLDRLALLKKLAEHVAKNHSKAHLMLLLLDERPEEVPEMADGLDCEMAYACFDETPDNQVRTAEMAIERAMRLVEQKKDVVMLVDSLTRFAHACNTVAPSTARTLSSGLAAGALNKPKRFFGAARNTREGGSLTIIATMMTESGSDLDTAVFQSFEGNSNMICALRQQGANQPVIMTPDKCSTVHDEWLLTDKEQAIAQKLREMIKDKSAAEAMNTLLPIFVQAENNDALEALLNGENS